MRDMVEVGLEGNVWTMHLDCLTHVSPVISCRLCLVDWAAGHGAGRSGWWIWVL